MDAILQAHDGDVQIIDTSRLRVHQQRATAKRGIEIDFLGCSKGGLTIKPHALVHRKGRLLQLKLTARQRSDIESAPEMIDDLSKGAMLLADKSYYPNALRDMATECGVWAYISPRTQRKTPICFSKHRYRVRSLVEHFFNKIKQYRRIATRYDKIAENFLAALKLVAVRLWQRGNV